MSENINLPNPVINSLVDLHQSGLGELEQFIKEELWLDDPKKFNPHTLDVDIIKTTWHALGNWLGNDNGDTPEATKRYEKYFSMVTAFLQERGVLGENAVEEQARFLADLQGGELV